MRNEENAIKSAEKVAPENFVNFVKALFRRFDEEKNYFAACKKDIENELRQIVAAIRTGGIPTNGRLPVYRISAGSIEGYRYSHYCQIPGR